MLITAFGETRTPNAWNDDGRCVVSRKALIKRIEQGWDHEKALTTPARTTGSKGGRSGNTYTAFGETKSVNAWSEDSRCVVSRTMLRKRLTNGWSMEDALRAERTKNPGFSLREAWGEKKTLADWVRDDRCVVSYGLLIYRLSKGLTLEEALSAASPMPQPAEEFEAFNESKSLSSWTKDDRCVVDNPSTLDSRIKRLKLPVEQSLTIPVRKLASVGEKGVGEFVKSLGLEIQTNATGLIGRKELDILIPELNIAIEFNGVFWHSEHQRDKSYHHDKWKACKDAGIQLFQIWEDDWRDKGDIIRAGLTMKLGKYSGPRVFARNCEVVSVSHTDAAKLLDAHHIQGSVNSTIRLGLEHDNELVAVACFASTGDENEPWNLVRYGTSVAVVGGFGKLMKSFRCEYEGAVKTFADLCWSDGELYRKTGFREVQTLRPDYSYLVNDSRKHKFLYRKNRFKTDLNLLYDENLTESELAELNGMNRVWDAGKIKFVMD